MTFRVRTIVQSNGPIQSISAHPRCLVESLQTLHQSGDRRSVGGCAIALVVEPRFECAEHSPTELATLTGLSLLCRALRMWLRLEVVRRCRTGSRTAFSSRHVRPCICRSDPNGIRTRVTAVKGRCPNRWTIGSLRGWEHGAKCFGEQGKSAVGNPGGISAKNGSNRHPDSG